MNKLGNSFLLLSVIHEFHNNMEGKATSSPVKTLPRNDKEGTTSEECIIVYLSRLEPSSTAVTISMNQQLKIPGPVEACYVKLYHGLNNVINIELSSVIHA